MDAGVPALEQALARLRAADRRRRLWRRLWFGLGGAAFVLAACWALAHTPTGTLHPAAIWLLAAVAFGAGLKLGESAAATDEVLARSVDAGSELPQMALTVVAPLTPAPSALSSAVRDQTEQELRDDDRPHRLPKLPPVVWPAIGSAAALCFYLLLPVPPNARSPRDLRADAAHGRPETGDGTPEDGQGGDAPAGAAGRDGAGDPPNAPQNGAAPQANPEPQPQPAAGTQPQPKQSPSNQGSDQGSSELYGDPDRLKVNKEKIKVDSLFDETAEGVKRTVLLPDPPKPTQQPAGRDRPRGTVPDEIKRADEAALSERITDPAERDTVQRYFELLQQAAAESRKK